MGRVLAIVIIFVRQNLPGSPRWLVAHGRQEEAEASMALIEEAARRDGQVLELIDERTGRLLLPEKQYGYLTFLRLAFLTYPKRATLGASLMITQSILYNAIFFTYAIVLTNFYHVNPA